MRLLSVAHNNKLDFEHRKIKKEAINSERLAIKNRNGKTIIGYHDYVNNLSKDKYFIVIPPAYGETKRDYISTAYYLTVNGFDVVRYDNTDHIGESDGEIANTNLLTMRDDLIDVFDYVEQTFSVKRIGIVASSLAVRIAIKACAQDKRIGFLLSLAGLVDLESSLNLIYREDLVESYRSGKRWGMVDIMGFEVHDDLIGAAIKNNVASLADTKDDIKNVECPIVFLVAEKDAWVNYKDVEAICENKDNCKAYVIPSAFHQIQENPRLARIVIMQIVKFCIEYIKNENKQIDSIFEPDVRYLVKQNKVEMASLKALTKITKEGEKNFWDSYLSKYLIITKSDDFRSLLDFIVNSFGEIRMGDKILDAGCGNGHFGSWLIRRILESQAFNNSAQKKEYTSADIYYYAGVDFVYNALHEAQRIHNGIMIDYLKIRRYNCFDLIKCQYILSDLEKQLPFKTDYFDNICCNLVVSYLKNPVGVIKRLREVLKSGGKIIVTSLKPYSDLSLVYSNYANNIETEEELLEGRKLLSAAGKIRQKEKEGHYHFFAEEELSDLMSEAGFIGINIFRSFGDQANVALARKAEEI